MFGGLREGEREREREREGERENKRGKVVVDTPNCLWSNINILALV